jgi:hypothetical protein
MFLIRKWSLRQNGIFIRHYHTNKKYNHRNDYWHQVFHWIIGNLLIIEVKILPIYVCWKSRILCINSWAQNLRRTLIVSINPNLLLLNHLILICVLKNFLKYLYLQFSLHSWRGISIRVKQFSYSIPHAKVVSCEFRSFAMHKSNIYLQGLSYLFS